MLGTDHMPPVRNLVDRVPEDTQVVTLAEPLTNTETKGLQVVRGELRSAARANLLPNVVSARIDLKQACAAAERALERYAEPLQALYGEEWSQKFLAVDSPPPLVYRPFQTVNPASRHYHHRPPSNAH